MGEFLSKFFGSSTETTTTTTTGTATKTTSTKYAAPDWESDFWSANPTETVATTSIVAEGVAKSQADQLKKEQERQEALALAKKQATAAALKAKIAREEQEAEAERLEAESARLEAEDKTASDELKKKAAQAKLAAEALRVEEQEAEKKAKEAKLAAEEAAAQEEKDNAQALWEREHPAPLGRDTPCFIGIMMSSSVIAQCRLSDKINSKGTCAVIETATEEESFLFNGLDFCKTVEVLITIILVLIGCGIAGMITYRLTLCYRKRNLQFIGLP
jgi:hypothetical protein